MMGEGLMYGYHYGMGWMLLGLVFWIAIITGVVLLVLWIVGKSGKLRHEHKEESALEILNRRYARYFFSALSALRAPADATLVVAAARTAVMHNTFLNIAASHFLCEIRDKSLIVMIPGACYNEVTIWLKSYGDSPGKEAAAGIASCKVVLVRQLLVCGEALA
ncbi:MAG TPA: hypothetical protein PLI53_12580 [Geobacteraceae bacterium]|nr:hypothetical protein [Geobacteraceae bacterium]